MLVLSRQKNESILIGDDVDITVIDIRGDKVRLGIKAPRDVTVHRKEVYDAIRRENQSAAALRPEDVPVINPNLSTAPLPLVKPLSVAVLVSGSGTTLQNLIDVTRAGRLKATVDLVIGSRPGLLGVERAQSAGIRNHVVDRKSSSDVSTFSAEIFKLCADAKVDLICLAGWLSLIELPARWAGRVMNIHPALLPGFGGRGMFGRKVHEAVIAHGCKMSGCTVHFVDDSYDTGPIIVQRTCPVLDHDTPEDLAKRVFEQEKIAYPEAIARYARGELKIEGRRVVAK